MILASSSSPEESSEAFLLLLLLSDILFYLFVFLALFSFYITNLTCSHPQRFTENKFHSNDFTSFFVLLVSTGVRFQLVHYISNKTKEDLMIFFVKTLWVRKEKKKMRSFLDVVSARRPPSTKLVVHSAALELVLLRPML